MTSQQPNTASEESTDKPDCMTDGPYGPVTHRGSGSKLPATIAATIRGMFAILLFYGVGTILMILFVWLVMSPDVGISQSFPEDPERLNDTMTLLGMMSMFLVLSPGMALSAVLWNALVEKRSLASMGLQAHRPASKYLSGLVSGGLLGILYLTVMMLVAWWMNNASLSDVEFDFHRLSEPSVWQFLAIAGVILLVPSFCEEITFRGWLLSSTSRRINISTSVAISSVLFSLFHIDRLTLGLGNGALTLVMLGVLGVIFCRLALSSSGLFGAAGAHGGYNVMVIVGGLAATAVSTNAEGGQIAIEMLSLTQTDFNTPASTVQLVFGVVVFVLIAAFIRYQPASRKC